MIRFAIIIFLFSAGIILNSCSDSDRSLELIELNGTFIQWEPVSLTLFHQVNQAGEIQKLLSNRYLHGIFRNIDKEIIVHGYSEEYNINSDNSTWKLNFTPSDYGIWSYQVILTEDLITTKKELEKYLNAKKHPVHSGTFRITPRKNNTQFSSDPGFVSYSRDGFFYRGNIKSRYIYNGIRVDHKSIVQFNEFTKSEMKHASHKTRLAFLANQDSTGNIQSDSVDIEAAIESNAFVPGLNGIKVSIPEIFPNYCNNDYSKSEFEILNDLYKNIDTLNEFGYLTVLEIFNFDADVVEGLSHDQKARIHLHNIIARFSHNTGLIWVINTTGYLDNSKQEIKEITRFVRNLDPYNHPILITCDHNVKSLKSFAGYPFIEGVIMESSEEIPPVYLFEIKEVSAQKGKKWILFEDAKSIRQSEKMMDIVWMGVLAGRSGYIWDMKSIPDFYKINPEFSFMNSIQKRLSTFTVPYNTSLINDSLNSIQKYGIQSDGKFFMTYSSGYTLYQLDSLLSGSFSIKWIDLDSDSIFHESDTLLNGQYNNLTLSSPNTNDSKKWLSVIQAINN